MQNLRHIIFLCNHKDIDKFLPLINYERAQFLAICQVSTEAAVWNCSEEKVF